MHFQLADGDGAAQSHFVKNGTETKTFTVSGDNVTTTPRRWPWPQIAEGTRAPQSYFVKNGTQTKTFPVISDIVATTYAKIFAVQSMGLLLQIAEGTYLCRSELLCEEWHSGLRPRPSQIRGSILQTLMVVLDSGQTTEVTTTTVLALLSRLERRMRRCCPR